MDNAHRIDPWLVGWAELAHIQLWYPGTHWHNTKGAVPWVLMLHIAAALAAKKGTPGAAL